MRTDKVDIANLGIVPECCNQPVLIFVDVKHDVATHIVGAFKILYYIGGGLIISFFNF